MVLRQQLTSLFLEEIFLGLIKKAGYPELKFEKKVDFEKLYSERSN